MRVGRTHAGRQTRIIRLIYRVGGRVGGGGRAVGGKRLGSGGYKSVGGGGGGERPRGLPGDNQSPSFVTAAVYGVF